MKKVTMAALAVVVVALLCASAVLYADSRQDETYSIHYELNGGENDPLNPDSYSTGDGCSLRSPSKDGSIFDRWYLDLELTRPCDSVAPGTSGDLTLYAGWSDDLSGRGFVMTVRGEVNKDFLTGYDLHGSVAYSCIHYDADGDRYLMRCDTEVLRDYGMASQSSSDSNTYWNDESSGDYTVTSVGTETIDTVLGPKECEVFLLMHSDGSEEKQWIGDGWIPYKIEFTQDALFSETRITYTFSEQFRFEVDDAPEVTVYRDAGIGVSGDGTYSPGDDVTLSASGDGFAGWYDENMTLLSDSRTYTFMVGGSDTVIYALNGVIPDISAVAGTDSRLDAGIALDSAEWTVLSGDGVVATMSGPEPTLNLSAPGEYVILIDGTSGGSQYHGYRDLRVGGVTELDFEWSFDGKDYTYTLQMDYSDLVRYREMTPVSDRVQDVFGHERDRQFVTYGDPYIVKMASDFADMTRGMDDRQRAGFILSFVQGLEYMSDDMSMGCEEYWKYPVETLFDGGGDCEDTSILFCAIAEAMDMDTMLLLMPGHMAAGVALENGSGTYYRYNGQEFYYCETTSEGFAVGVRPAGVGDTVTPVAICV